jgi:hypothetical protein
VGGGPARALRGLAPGDIQGKAALSQRDLVISSYQ